MESEISALLEGFDKEKDTSGLGPLSDLCEQMAVAKAEMEAAEAALEEKKKAFNALRIGKIPDLMQELGLGELKLSSGAVIKIKRSVLCKFMPETKEAALNWLDAAGHSDIIRREVGINFEKGQEDAAEQAANILEEAGFNPFIQKDVHHATLKAWATREVEAAEAKRKAGVPDEEIPRIPSELFNFDFFNIAEVK